ncbi:MAG: hypothetical protein KFF73_06315 [Cyclobacteriaceae bacterium]|nr:hypothetical protein [Cyclobacteriaceae bacterium]
MIIRPDLQIFDQINFPDELIVNLSLFYSDIDSDSLMEINVFTFKNDSIFLSSVEFLTLDRPINRWFISIGTKVNDMDDFYAGPGYAFDFRCQTNNKRVKTCRQKR